MNQNYVDTILKNFVKGEKNQSISQLKKYLEKNPEDIRARYNLGVMYQQTNNIEGSIKAYLYVIKRDKKHWQSLVNLGLLYFSKGLYEESNHFNYRVLKIKKGYQPTLRDIGTNHLMLRNYKIAEDILTKSLKLNSVDYINMNALGLVKMRLDKHEEAKRLYLKAIQVNKNYYTTYNNLGLYYERIGETEKAFNCYKQTLSIEPNYPNSLNNLGMLYFYYEENKKAFECFNRALKIDPKMSDLYFNLGHAYFKMRKFKEAENWFQKGFKISPENLNGHYNYSFLLLATHQYKKAWNEFDYRLKRSININENPLYEVIKNKIWDNQKLKDKKILIVREQGAGDEILYGSMYRELIKSGNDIKIEADPRILPLFERATNSSGIFIEKDTISQNKKLLKKIDLIIFAGSLGKIFRKNKKNFPNKNIYLETKDNLLNKIKSELDNVDNNLKVGLSWFSKNKRIGGGKSMTLDALKPVLKNKKVTFVNLQYGDHDQEIVDFKNKTGIDIINLKHIDKFNDFESLAALIKSLDLMITVSNTTAHLAGAVGQNTWVMAPKNDSLLFYWNTGEESTPWYPSVKIFSKIKTWDDTIKKINIELKKWINKKTKN